MNHVDLNHMNRALILSFFSVDVSVRERSVTAVMLAKKTTLKTSEAAGRFWAQCPDVQLKVQESEQQSRESFHNRHEKRKLC